MKKDLVFFFFLFLVFWAYEFFSFLGVSLAFDPFFPFLLGGIFWRLHLPFFVCAVFFFGLLADVFSFGLPGPSVISYFLSLFVFYQFERRLALRGFFPALLSLVTVVIFCEVLRLFLLPLIFELPLPKPSFYFVGKFVVGTLLWGLLGWLFCQVSFIRDVLEVSAKNH